MRLRVEPRLADPTFVYYYVSAPASRQKLIRDSESTGVPKINLAYLRSFPILLPPLAEQRAIAHVLGALDDKIELNRKMNETLEGIAQALFKSWFVDFDPVRAKAAGRQPAGMDAATAALFPREFEDSELGQTPKRWRVGTVGELSTVSRDSLNPGDYPTEVFDLYSIAAFDEGRAPAQDAGSQIMSQKLLVRPGSILLSKLNPRIPRLWCPNVGSERRSVCSTEFVVMLPTNVSSREHLYGVFSSDAFRDEIRSLATGTSGSHQRANVDDLLAVACVVPDPAAIAAYTEIAVRLHERVSGNLAEISTLAAIRDTLLPKLVSGEVRITDRLRIGGAC
jgi:type I restriction enzyme S subunit